MDTPWGPGSIPGEGSQNSFARPSHRDTYIHVFLSEPGPA